MRALQVVDSGNASNPVKWDECGGFCRILTGCNRSVQPIKGPRWKLLRWLVPSAGNRQKFYGTKIPVCGSCRSGIHPSATFLGNTWSSCGWRATIKPAKRNRKPVLKIRSRSRLKIGSRSGLFTGNRSNLTLVLHWPIKLNHPGVAFTFDNDAGKFWMGGHWEMLYRWV